jgi:hypothetical protein
MRKGSPASRIAAALALSAAALVVGGVCVSRGGEALREGRSVLSDEWRERVEASKATAADYQARATASFLGLRVTLPSTARAPATSYLDDPTLREGDIVAAPAGLRVFVGRPGLPHREADFVALDLRRDRAGTHDGELHAIDAGIARGATEAAR